MLRSDAPSLRPSYDTIFTCGCPADRLGWTARRDCAREINVFAPQPIEAYMPVTPNAANRSYSIADDGSFPDDSAVAEMVKQGIQKSPRKADRFDTTEWDAELSAFRNIKPTRPDHQ